MPVAGRLEAHATWYGTPPETWQKEHAADQVNERRRNKLGENTASLQPEYFEGGDDHCIRTGVQQSRGGAVPTPTPGFCSTSAPAPTLTPGLIRNIKQ